MLAVLLQYHDLKTILKESVSFGGDVDTTASLSLALGSLSVEIDQNLPQWLERDLENGDFGADYLKELDQYF